MLAYYNEYVNMDIYLQQYFVCIALQDIFIFILIHLVI